MAKPQYERFVRDVDAPLLTPPVSETGVIGWLWHNIFESCADFTSLGSAVRSLFMAGFTVFVAWLGLSALWGVLDFAVFSAVWSDPDGIKREACWTVEQGGALPAGWHGACWPFVITKMKFMMYGAYDSDQLWRVNVTGVMGLVGLVLLMIPSTAYGRFMPVTYPLTNIIRRTYPLTNIIRRFAGQIIPSNFGRRFVKIFMAVYSLIARIIPSISFRQFVGLFMVAVYPLIAVILLAGGSVLDMSLATMGVATLLGLGLLTLARLGKRGFLGDVISSFAGGFEVGGWVLIGYAVVVTILGWDYGLNPITTNQWGGLLVTLVVAITGIVASLPLGVVLALGRRSSMPIARILSVAFIEFWRGVPLITVLFMASVMLPLFLPEGVNFDNLLRALIGVMLFSAAYMAEVVRGGLQAMDRGQYEGADALGLTYWQKMRLIILPQALTHVIPGIVNTFIGLFKDTTLVSIIGLFDLLGAAQAAVYDAAWSSPVQAHTAYFFVASLFFIFCFGMSRYSIYMENKLSRDRRH